MKRLRDYMPFSFCNTPDEWHSLVNGFCNAFCLFIPRMIDCITPAYEVKEKHYYYFGNVLGFPAGMISVLAIARFGFWLFQGLTF